MRKYKEYDNNRRKYGYVSHERYSSYNNEKFGKKKSYKKISKYHNRYYRNQEKFKTSRERDQRHVRIKISNLDYTISKNDLIELFSNVCNVVDAWVNYDHTDRSDGTAVCIFENMNDAQKAFDKYEGIEIEGLPMKMEIIHGKKYINKKNYRSRCPW